MLITLRAELFVNLSIELYLVPFRGVLSCLLIRFWLRDIYPDFLLVQVYFYPLPLVLRFYR